MLKTIILLALTQLSTSINCENLNDQKYYVVKHNNEFDLSLSEFNDSNFSSYSINSEPISYQCFIPNFKDHEEARDSYEMTAANLQKERDHTIEIIKNFNFNLRGSSAYIETGYWNYMLRFDHDIHQYHRDMTESGPAALFNYKLAAWSDNDDSKTFESTPYYSAKSPKDPYDIKSDFEMLKLEDGTKYVSQRIGNGEICDLTGLPRSTTINYYCNEKQETPLIRNIHEWRTCEYIIDLESNEFCDHSMWKKPNTLVNNIIDCFPTKSLYGFSEELIDLQQASLDPLTDGIFLVRKGDSLTFSALLTKKYDLWSDSLEKSDLNFQQLLRDISVGFQRYIKNKKLKAFSNDKQLQLQLTLQSPFQMVFKLYDIDRSHIGNIRLEQDENGFIVSSFVDDEVPENNFLINIHGGEVHEDKAKVEEQIGSEEIENSGETEIKKDTTTKVEGL